MSNSKQFSAVMAEPKASYDASAPGERFIEVLVDFPGAPETQKLYTYRLPADLTVQPGDILSVPFGAQQVGSIAIRLLSQLPPDLTSEKIRYIEDVVCSGFFPFSYWELIERVAQYYYTPLMQVIKVALPPGLLARSSRRIRLNADKSGGSTSADAFLSPAARQILGLLRAQPDGDYSWKHLQGKVRNAHQGLRELLRRRWVESYFEAPKPTRPKLQKAVTLVIDAFPSDLTPRQREVLEVLRRRGGDLWLSELLQICSTSSSTLKALEQKGYITIEQREVLRKDYTPLVASEEAKSLTDAQAQALATITQLSGTATVLLHGVTGSGKTEVYLQAIAPVLECGQSALVLVPEIGLTPQLTDRFTARFGNKVCVYHSALSDGERYDTWRQMLTGEPQVVIGTRSAVFAPLPKLGLIFLDEEHDSSFKQEQKSPTYHARTVATWRSELENCPLVLGSATPSLETWVNINQQGTAAQENSTHYLSLPERVYSRPLPPVEVIDMRQELRDGNRSIFSRSLQESLQQLHERQQQGILFIHRRGYSTFVSCRSCGYVIECPNCDVSLAYHHSQEGAVELLRCHYCNFVRSHPQNCPECGSPYLKFFGSGTQRIEQEIARQFPQLSCIRFDSDTTRTKGAHRSLLTRFTNREADLLIGTQMLTKGLDLPQVTVVGVVAADGLLYLGDYRASERAFQTLTQVAGRSGRGNDPGKVIIQTYTPEHAVIQAVRRHEYQSFIEAELQQRAALNYPPYGRLILYRLSSVDERAVEEAAEILGAELRQTESDETVKSSYEILGPAPANIMRIANKYRWQILLKFPPDVAVELPDLAYLRTLCPDSVSLTIDVDPLNLS